MKSPLFPNKSCQKRPSFQWERLIELPGISGRNWETTIVLISIWSRALTSTVYLAIYSHMKIEFKWNCTITNQRNRCRWPLNFAFNAAQVMTDSSLFPRSTFSLEIHLPLVIEMLPKRFTCHLHITCERTTTHFSQLKKTTWINRFSINCRNKRTLYRVEKS